MKGFRIVFMGTPEFAVTIVKALVENQYNIVGVVTAPDKPSGRGRKLNESAVKIYARSQNIPVLQPTNLKNESFIAELRSLNADLQIVVAFRMLPKVVWSMPVYGTFNLHASLLPDYRGAAPIHWAIINGEQKTGVTTFFIDENIDTGAIILQKETGIREDETVGELHETLMHLGADLVLETIDLIASGKANPKKQPSTDTKTAPKLYPDTCKIDWNKPIYEVYNKIRGLNPFPAAWSYLKNGEELIMAKIYAVEKIIETHTLKPGSIILSKKQLKVAVKGGYINILEIKLSGKKKMDSASLINGYHFEKEVMMC